MPEFSSLSFISLGLSPIFTSKTTAQILFTSFGSFLISIGNFVEELGIVFVLRSLNFAFFKTALASLAIPIIDIKSGLFVVTSIS